MNTLINYTKAFGFFRGVDSNTTNWTKQKAGGGVIRNTMDTALARHRIDYTAKDAKGNTMSYMGSSRLGINPMKTVNKATLTKGSIVDRVKWNTGGGAKAAQMGAGTLGSGGTGKLSFGSKAKIGTITAGSGILAGKIGGSIAENRARTQAVKAGLTPGTPEYNKYVQNKAKAGKIVSGVVGGALGFAGSRYLGKNTFRSSFK
jgi:hypothetical protein